MGGKKLNNAFLARQDTVEFFYLGENNLEREATYCDTAKEDNNIFHSNDSNTSV